MDFNESFKESGEKPRFIYKRNPLVEYAYQIFEFFEEKSNYEPIGEYTVIDKDEPSDITEKKLFNLLAIMNNKKDLVDFKNLTNSRVLFNIIPKDPDSEQQKIIFRTHDGKGVSVENAVLTLEKGVFDGQL